MKERKYYVRVSIISNIEDSKDPTALPTGAIINCQETRTLPSHDLTLATAVAVELAQKARSAFHRSVAQYVRRHGSLDQ